MPDKQRLEEQILSQAAKNTLSNQLDEVEQIDVDVRTDLLKIAQGQVEEVSLTGQGLVLQKDIRVQEIKVKTDSIAVNPLSAIFGQIELNEPVNAIARVVMTEVDINHALSSDFIHSQAKIWQLNVDSEIVSFHLQQIQVSLPGSGKIEFSGTVLLEENRQSRPLGFIARVSLPTHSQPLRLESFNCTQGEGISVPLITALMHKLKELLQSSDFAWEDMILRIKDVEVKKENLILLVEAHVKQIPSTENLSFSK
jgi:LmeA-like phospholipid-binding